MSRLYRCMSAMRTYVDASPATMLHVLKWPSASSEAFMASAILPFIIWLWATVKRAAARTCGLSSSFRAMERASLAIFVALSAVAFWSFSLPLPSSSFCTYCMIKARTVMTMALTSSSLSPVSFINARSEPSARKAASKSFSTTCTSMRTRIAFASPWRSPASTAFSWASLAMLAAFLRSPSTNCAAAICRSADTSPSTLPAS
mmetsp:Transcript_66489/g.150081  ORF Transcript_66489/g.150081 Transcript_66489/m.150081 type:complete len:203 (-) Transcript_66489:1300-1908(-)